MANPYDYLKAISQVERAHSQFFDVVKLELDALESTTSTTSRP
jgi:hypothetical protein